jgi:hypothetical protein
MLLETKTTVLHKLIGADVKADHQWGVVELILTEFRPFTAEEKKSFRDLSKASDYCTKVDERTRKTH